MKKSTLFTILTLLLCGTAAISYAQYQGRPVLSTGPGITKGDGSGGLTAAIAGTDFATPQQAAHSGGAIGTASFNAVGGSISSLVKDGVITEVNRRETGAYAVTVSGQDDANYVVLASLGGNGADQTWSYTIPGSDKGKYGFILEARVDGFKSDNSDSIQIAVMRLSQ